MMLSFVFYLWVLLTISVAVICSFAAIQPYWFVHPDTIHAFGIINYCKATDVSRDIVTSPTSTCLPYGDHFRIGNIPNGAWRATFLLLATGSGSLVVSVIGGFLITCLDGVWRKQLSIIVSYVQITSVILMASALFAYPLGMRSTFFRYYCGQEAHVYYASQCSMGWAYMLAVMGTSLSMFCPILWSLKGDKGHSQRVS